MTHIFFWNGQFSQWENSPFADNGIIFSTAEQYMMYNKAILFGDDVTANQIIATKDPSRQKFLGRQVLGFKDEVWNAQKFEIVVKGNILKFSQNEELKKNLLLTGAKILVEGSPYDKVWGVGLNWDDPKILEESNWKGENLLGKALIEVRKQLLNEKALS